jgi:hypothetical protein
MKKKKNFKVLWLLALLTFSFIYVGCGKVANNTNPSNNSEMSAQDKDALIALGQAMKKTKDQSERNPSADASGPVSNGTSLGMSMQSLSSDFAKIMAPGPFDPSSYPTDTSPWWVVDTSVDFYDYQTASTLNGGIAYRYTSSDMTTPVTSANVDLNNHKLITHIKISSTSLNETSEQEDTYYMDMNQVVTSWSSMNVGPGLWVDSDGFSITNNPVYWVPSDGIVFITMNVASTINVTLDYNLANNITCNILVQNGTLDLNMVQVFSIDYSDPLNPQMTASPTGNNTILINVSFPVIIEYASNKYNGTFAVSLEQILAPSSNEMPFGDMTATLKRGNTIGQGEDVGSITIQENGTIVIVDLNGNTVVTI